MGRETLVLSSVLALSILSGAVLASTEANLAVVDTSERIERKAQHKYLAEEQSQLPTISAALKKYNQHNPDSVVTNWIQLSPEGMRVRDVHSNSEVIKNFNQQRVWLTNNRSKTSHEVDIAFYRKFFPDQVRYLIGHESLSNISGVKPCADLEGVYMGRRVWRGQVVGEWECQYEDGTFANSQFFSDRWNLVVYVKHIDKSIEELVDIQSETLTESSFVPEKTLRHVEIAEFMTGRRLLDSYSP